VQYFGAGPVPPALDRVDTPVGRLCLDCSVPVVAGDVGFMLPFVGGPDDEKTAVYHRACLARCLGVDLK
jgi:hypothetical protein